MIARLLRITAWLCLAFIIFATVSPMDLRPRDPLPVNFDRALAFALMSGLFVLAYPRRWLMVLVLSIAGAGLIEGLQLFSPSRHAHAGDALVKAAGALVGVTFAAACNYLTGRGRRKRIYVIGIDAE